MLVDNGVYDQVTIVTSRYDNSGGCGAADYYPSGLKWKCGYSGIYKISKDYTTRTPDTPGRTGTEYVPGSDPVGDDVTDSFWDSADVWRPD